MNTLLAFIHAHPLFIPVAMFIFNMAISNMPDPDATSGKGYKWLYGTLHGIIGGLGNAIFAAKSGGVQSQGQMLKVPIAKPTGSYSDLSR